MKQHSHEPSEIQRALADKLSFSPVYQWVLRILGVVIVTTFLMALVDMVGLEQHPGKRVWYGWAFFLLLGVFILHSLEKRLHLGAVVVDWTGVYVNRLLVSSFTPWSRVDRVNGACLILKTGSSIQIGHRYLLESSTSVGEILNHRYQSALAWNAMNPVCTDPIFVTEGLSLRPWSTEDYPSFKRCFTDPEMIRFMRYSSMSHRRLRERFKRLTNSQYHPQWTGHYSIVCGDSIIGHFDWWMTDVQRIRLKIAYGIYPEHRRQGLMTRVLTGFTHHVFTHWHVAEIEAQCDAGNLASQKTLLRSGFTGTLKDSEILLFSISSPITDSFQSNRPELECPL